MLKDKRGKEQEVRLCHLSLKTHVRLFLLSTCYNYIINFIYNFIIKLLKTEQNFIPRMKSTFIYFFKIVLMKIC